MRVITNQKEVDKIEKEAKGIPDESLDVKEVDSLVAYLNGCWDEASKAKEAHSEPQILRNMRQIDGTYDSDKLAAIREVGGSEVFMMITNAKCKNAKDWVEEIMFQQETAPFDIQPTPVPSLPDYIQEEIYMETIQEVISSLQSEMGQSEDMVGISDVFNKMQEVLPEINDAAKNAVLEYSRKMAKDIMREVDDKLIEGGWYSALKKCTKNIIMHTGILCGPMPKKRPSIKIKPMPNGRLVSHIVNEVVPTWESIHPLDVYPSPDSTDINDGYLFIKTRLTPIALQEMIGVPGYDEDEIKAVLEEVKNGILAYEWSSVDQEKAEIEDNPSPLSYDSSKIDCLRFHGAVSGKLLKEWGISKDAHKDTIEEHLFYDICAYLVGSHVIAVQFNKDPLGRKPYYKASFEEVDGSFWGKGLPQTIYDVQTVCNAIARGIVNNAGMGSGPQVERNVDRIPSYARQDNKLIPWRVWDTTSDVMSSSAPALKFYQPPMVVERLQTVYINFSKIADEHSGVPAYAHGDPQVGGAGSTASGLSMLMGGAARGIRAIIKNIDENIIKPSVSRQYSYMIEREDYYGMVCDYQVVSGGVMAAIAREQLAARRIEFMNTTANPIDAQIIGMEGRKYVLTETAKSVNMDLEKFMPKNMPQQLPAPEEAAGQSGFGAPGAAGRQLDAAGNPIVGQDVRMFNQ